MEPFAARSPRRPAHPPLPADGADGEEDEGAAAATASWRTAASGAASCDGGGLLWTAVFEYEACGEDELSLRPGDVVQVLSQDSQVSGDEGWWTGQLDQRVGIFPSNYIHYFLQ
uniref:SH3 domain-containing protein n=1 Tax=Podarcis muralis TaxID=64176 RepID=A0A670I921_PODMU